MAKLGLLLLLATSANPFFFPNFLKSSIPEFPKSSHIPTLARHFESYSTTTVPTTAPEPQDLFCGGELPEECTQEEIIVYEEETEETCGDEEEET